MQADMHSDMEMMLTAVVHSSYVFLTMVAVATVVYCVYSLYRLTAESLKPKSPAGRYFPYFVFKKSLLTDKGVTLRRHLIIGLVVLIVLIISVGKLLDFAQDLPPLTIGRADE